jgi:hypothetical protein
MHAESVAFLDAALKAEKANHNEGVKNAIVTDHGPTFQHYPTKYIGSILDEARNRLSYLHEPI